MNVVINAHPSAWDNPDYKRIIHYQAHFSVILSSLLLSDACAYCLANVRLLRLYNMKARASICWFIVARAQIYLTIVEFVNSPSQETDLFM